MGISRFGKIEEISIKMNGVSQSFFREGESRC